MRTLKLAGLLSGLLVLLLSGLCWAESPPTSSDDQIKSELTELLNSVEAKLIDQEQQINSLEKNLQEREKAYNDLNLFTRQKQQELNTLKEKIANSETLQKELEDQIKTLENSLNDVEKLLRKYERQIKWLKFKWKAALILGIVFGAAADHYANR
jgi:chromosome segregation ATPase